jgi:hypothetical protein
VSIAPIMIAVGVNEIRVAVPIMSIDKALATSDIAATSMVVFMSTLFIFFLLLPKRHLGTTAWAGYGLVVRVNTYNDSPDPGT